MRYAGYNLAVIPPVLAALRLHETRKETLIAGALTGPIAMIPGLLFFLPMIGMYPEIVDAAVPSTVLLERLGSRGFQIAFQLVLFGTLIETGAGLIHAFNERIAGLQADREVDMAWWVRPAVAVGLLGVGTFVSSFGLIGLIARGYGTMTIGFIRLTPLSLRQPFKNITTGRVLRHSCGLNGMPACWQAARKIAVSGERSACSVTVRGPPSPCRADSPGACQFSAFRK